MHSTITYKMQCEHDLASELMRDPLLAVNTADTCFGYINLVNFIKFCRFYPGILWGNIKSLLNCLDNKLSWL